MMQFLVNLFQAVCYNLLFPSVQGTVAAASGRITADTSFQRSVTQQVRMKQDSGIAPRPAMLYGRNLEHFPGLDHPERHRGIRFRPIAYQCVKVAWHADVVIESITGQIGHPHQRMQGLLPGEPVEQVYSNGAIHISPPKSSWFLSRCKIRTDRHEYTYPDYR